MKYFSFRYIFLHFEQLNWKKNNFLRICLSLVTEVTAIPSKTNSNHWIEGWTSLQSSLAFSNEYIEKCSNPVKKTWTHQGILKSLLCKYYPLWFIFHNTWLSSFIDHYYKFQWLLNGAVWLLFTFRPYSLITFRSSKYNYVVSVSCLWSSIFIFVYEVSKFSFLIRA